METKEQTNPQHTSQQEADKPLVDKSMLSKIPHLEHGKKVNVLWKTLTGATIGAVTGIATGMGLATRGTALETTLETGRKAVNLLAGNVEQRDTHKLVNKLQDVSAHAFPAKFKNEGNKFFQRRGEIALVGIISMGIGAVSGYRAGRSQNQRADDMRKWGMVERQHELADARWQLVKNNREEDKSFQARVEEKLDKLAAQSVSR